MNRFTNITGKAEGLSISKKIGKFILKTLGYLLIILVFINGFVDILEGSFYRRYDHYYNLFLGHNTTNSGSIIFNSSQKDIVSFSPDTTSQSDENKENLDEENTKEILQVNSPDEVGKFQNTYPNISTYGPIDNPYFIGEDGYKCEILNRIDMQNAFCFKFLDTQILRKVVPVPKEVL